MVEIVLIGTKKELERSIYNIKDNFIINKVSKPSSNKETNKFHCSLFGIPKKIVRILPEEKTQCES